MQTVKSTCSEPQRHAYGIGHQALGRAQLWNGYETVARRMSNYFASASSCFDLIACIRSTFGNGCILISFFSFILTSNKISSSSGTRFSKYGNLTTRLQVTVLWIRELLNYYWRPLYIYLCNFRASNFRAPVTCAGAEFREFFSRKKLPEIFFRPHGLGSWYV